MRPIDADALKRELVEFCNINDSIFGIIRNCKTLDYAPVIHAHWIPQFVSKRGLSDKFSCSNCNELSATSHMFLNCPYKYCRHCGAKMDGKDGEKNG